MLRLGIQERSKCTADVSVFPFGYPSLPLCGKPHPVSACQAGYIDTQQHYRDDSWQLFCGSIGRSCYPTTSLLTDIEIAVRLVVRSRASDRHRTCAGAGKAPDGTEPLRIQSTRGGVFF